MPINPHEEFLRTLFTCFQRKDYQDMAACYAPEAEFNDAIFRVKGKGVAAIWNMLTAGFDLKVDFNILEAGEEHGRVHCGMGVKAHIPTYFLC